ncbi:cytokine receptor common subunit gamma-like [Symphorus nematophorus]
MPTRLLLLLCLTGHVFAKESPDVDCLVLHPEYVHCSWNKHGTPEVNYTFSSKFDSDENFIECTTYVLESGTNIGCYQPYQDGKRFHTFRTKLVHGNNTFELSRYLKDKVKLRPPPNVTVEMGSDSNLWVYWNQTKATCEESEISYRTKNGKWDDSKVSSGRNRYCINMPSSSSPYEVKVRRKYGKNCGESQHWSEWSDPVVWAPNNSTDTTQMNNSMSVWTPVLYLLGTLTLILLVMMLLHHERLRIILIPMVPKPSLISDDMDWTQLSKGLKDSSKANYNERTCTVREYCQVSQSDSESSDSSTSSVTTDQTDCSISIPVDKSDLSSPCSSSSSSTSTVVVSSEDAEQVSV